MTSRDLRWLNYVQNAAVAVLAVFHAVGGVQAAVDLGGVVVEVVEVVEVVIVVAVEDLGVMVAVVPIEVAVVHNLLFSQKKPPIVCWLYPGNSGFQCLHFRGYRFNPIRATLLRVNGLEYH
jgi:hypothetical protein